MPDLDRLIAEALQLFSAMGDVRARKMFGGAGIYAEGLMFALVADTIYVKAAGSLADDLARAGSAPFVFDSARGPVTTSYWQLPADAADPASAMDWGRRALACARDASGSRPPHRRRKPRG